MLTCGRCSESSLIEGTLNDNGDLVFLLSDSKKRLSETPIALACERCGHIELAINPESLTVRFRKESRKQS